jgi:hypothetical protein
MSFRSESPDKVPEREFLADRRNRASVDAKEVKALDVVKNMRVLVNMKEI